METSSGKAQILDMHAWAIKLTINYNILKQLQKIFGCSFSISHYIEEEKEKSDPLKINLAENTFKLEKIIYTCFR